MQLPYFDSSWFRAHRDCSISAVNRFAIAVPERDHLKTARKQPISTAYKFISGYKPRKRSQKQKVLPKYRRILYGIYRMAGAAEGGDIYGLQLAGSRSTWPSKITFASRMAGFAMAMQDQWDAWPSRVCAIFESVSPLRTVSFVAVRIEAPA